MNAPRRSREVHAEPIWRVLARQLLDEPHTMNVECLCEEPCRYCKCEVES